MIACFLPDAVADLHQIWAYVADDSASIDTANSVIDAIHERAQFDALNPELGSPRFELATDVRCFVASGFVVFYLPLEQGIEVLQVIHGSRDIPRHFRSGN